MRAAWLYTAVSILLLAYSCPSIATRSYAVLPRQDASSPSAAAASTTLPDIKTSQTVRSTDEHTGTSAATSPSPSSSGAAASASSKGETNSPLETSTKASDASAAATTFVGITATPIPKGSLNVTSANTTIVEGLPIPPMITPGMSVAGAFLILTGTFYSLIGIRTKWLQISLSSAYLVSLAVSVLIIYVMHPPISNVLQGVYVLAVILTGMIAGGGSLLFTDVTEGFSTFLGGFCLSMWFLVLRPGGLITNDVGRVIFIAFLTAGAFPLYLSHHTRPYGLIGATSFAGATVIVLGIDCFSRAGLKEFWLYIWSLNDNLFPLHYHQKYPITRGIRVEIAAIIIIALLGIMSQMKVWKIVKQKREERASEQKRKEHQRRISDEERGKEVEANNRQDQPLWEALHGGKGKANAKESYLDSGVGTDEPSSTRKSSWGDARVSDAGGMELQSMPVSRNGSRDKGRVTVHVAQDDFYEVSLVGGQRTSMERPTVDFDAEASNPFASETPSISARAKGRTQLIDPDSTLQPKIIPPPFKIPDLDAASDDDGSSVEASAPSEHLPYRGSKRLSGASMTRKLSKRSRNSYVAANTSEEVLMIPHIEDDRASSIAATHDGISDHGGSDEVLTYSRSQTPVVEKVLDDESREALEAASHDKVSTTSSIASAAAQGPASVALPSSRPASIALEEVGKAASANSVPSETSEQRAGRARLSGNLPAGGSKVVTAYRTNEWAKHLDAADVPEVDQLKVNKRQIRDQRQQGEQVAPLDVRALQQTPLTAEPAPLVTSPLQTSSHTSLPSSKSHPSAFLSKNPFSRHSKQQPPKLQPVLHPLTIAKNTERNPSQTSLANISRTSSQTSLNSAGSRTESHRPPIPKFRASQQSISPTPRGFRSSSTPLAATPLVESPIEEGVETSFPNARFTPHNAHLMSQRDRIISSKPSSTSLLRTSYSNVALDQHPAYRTIEEDDNDNITLAQRKSLLQQNPQAIHRSSSGPLTGAITPRYPSGTTTPIGIPSDPYRSVSTPIQPMPTQRDSTISAWRSSLKPDTSAHYEDQTMESRRADLLREKQREGTSRLEGQIKQGVRASVIDQGMRRGDMMDAHKAAMRKMQGEAKI